MKVGDTAKERELQILAAEGKETAAAQARRRASTSGQSKSSIGQDSAVDGKLSIGLGKVLRDELDPAQLLQASSDRVAKYRELINSGNYVIPKGIAQKLSDYLDEEIDGMRGRIPSSEKE